MINFSIPKRSEVSEDNQVIFDNLKKNIGFVPNLYAYYAKSNTALSDYLNLQNRKSTLKAKEREVINLVVSQFNDCKYCLAAHTAIGKMNGFNDSEILSIRGGSAPFDAKLNALAQFVHSTVQNHGRATQKAKDEFFAVGYDEENLIDVVMVIGDKIISNYIHNITDFAVDFPLAPALREELV
tara:strand:+ start:1577 stop:2125 length:549 start_codon:yes stop_codon:yes gene_type:complete